MAAGSLTASCLLWLQLLLLAQPTAMSTEPVGGALQNVTRLLIQNSHTPPDNSGRNATVLQIKFVAYSVIANIVVAVGIVGNILNLVVLTRPNLKGVMYVYLLGLAVSNLCVLLTAVPALYDIAKGLGDRGDYTTAFYQAHLELPLINAFMASSVYIIICMTVNRYISIYRPTHFQRIHTHKNAKLSIAASFLGGIVLHIPLCFQNTVVCRRLANEGEEESCHWKSVENELNRESFLFRAYLVVSEILLRFGPIITLAILNALIIYRFQKIAKKRQRLKGYSAATASGGVGGRPSRGLTPPSSPYPSNVISSGTQLSRMSVSTDTQVVVSSVPSSSMSGGLTTTTAIAKELSSCGGSSSAADASICLDKTTKTKKMGRQKHCRTSTRRRSFQSPEERMLVVVLISIVVLFVCCTTPAAVLSILYSVKLNHHLGFQVFRAVANNLELVNFALNFYIYCLCSAEIRRAFISLFLSMWNTTLGRQKTLNLTPTEP
jgi:7 transmembrane receptor (rhodopsin family)